MIDPNMSVIIRQDAASYYHQHLLDNQKVYDYLKKVELRSKEIIEKFKIGYSDEKLTKHLLNKGYSLEDIIFSGLAKSDGSDFIKKGNYIYPYFAEGAVECLAYKKKGSRNAKKTKGHENCIFYNQDAVNNISRGLNIVQDEDSLLSVLDRDSLMTNTVSVSGYVTDEHIKKIKEQGYGFLRLIFNNDLTGQKNLEKIIDNFRGTKTNLEQIKFGRNCITFDDYVRNNLHPGNIFYGTTSITISEAKRVGFILEQGFAYTYLSEKDSAIKIISNFLIDIVNRIISEDGTIKREVRLKNEGETSELFKLEPENMPTDRDFRKFCFSRGNFIFKGSTKELNELWEYVFSKDTGKKIYLIKQVGYVVRFDLYLYENIAIKNAKVFEKDENDVFWLDGFTGVKIDPISKERILPKLKIPGSEFNLDEYIHKVTSILNRNLGGYKGSVIIAYIVATVYSYEIYKKFGFFPILFVYGKLKSGKNIVCGFIMDFFGLRESETTLQEDSQTAISRLLNFCGGLPAWFDEYKASNQKIKLVDGFFRSVFNRVTPIKVTKEDYGIREVPIKGNLILSGEEMPTDHALRTRCISINLSERERKDEFYPEVLRLSGDFSKITAKLILTKNEESINRLLESIEKNKQYFKNFKIDARQAEVYAVISSSYEFLVEDISFKSWFEKQMIAESEKRSEESTVNNFWSDAEGLLKTKGLDPRNYFSLSRKQNKVYVWFAEIYRIVEENYRHRKFDSLVSKQTILDQLAEEPYFIAKGKTEMVGEDRRSCIILDLEKSPDSIKTICEVVDSKIK